MNHTQTGRIGEDIAVEYLRKKGYKIIQRNYRSRYAEIDIITQDRVKSSAHTLVFIEVRARTNEYSGTPEETITPQKKRKLIRNAEVWMAINKYNGPARIDAVCVAVDERGELKRLSHYKNITG